MLGLLTGNLSRIARAKLQQAGLAQYFSTGGFGEESMNRADLVPVALAHAAETFGVPLAAGEADPHRRHASGRRSGPGTRRLRPAAWQPADFRPTCLRAAGAHLVLESLADHERAVAQLLRVGR